jgi:hypothetical protein
MGLERVKKIILQEGGLTEFLSVATVNIFVMKCNVSLCLCINVFFILAHTIYFILCINLSLPINELSLLFETLAPIVFYSTLIGVPN